MSKEIDERVVSMKFDNKDFEKNVAQTIDTLDRLNAKLDFSESAKSFQEIERASDKVTMSGLNKALETVQVKFSTMSLVAMNAINRIVDSVTNAGIQMTKSLTIAPITSGFSKYESNLESVQAIMNSTGRSIEDVQTQMGLLMTYTDETSYSFTDMTANISKFTSQKIPLETATMAMMGIANAAGFAGVNVTQASHAMQGFSKAMAKGYMDRLSWQWLNTAQMAIPELKQQFIDYAEAAGTLVKVGDDVYKTLQGETVSVTDFESALKDGWLTTEVMNKALSDFGSYSSAVMKIMAEQGVECSVAMEQLDAYLEKTGNEAMILSGKMFKASQQSRTFTDAINSVKDAVSTGWMKTFEILFGNLEEAKDTWAEVGEILYDIFAEPGNARNALLEEWAKDPLGGRDVLIRSVLDLVNNLREALGAVKQAFASLFPPVTVKTLTDIVKKFSQFVATTKLSNKELASLYAIARVVLIPFQALFAIFKLGVQVVGSFVSVILELGKAFLYAMAVGNPFEDLMKRIFGEERYARLVAAFSTITTKIGEIFASASAKVREAFGGRSLLQVFLDTIGAMAEALAPLGEMLLDFVVWAFESLANLDYSGPKAFVNSLIGFFLTAGSTVFSLFTDGVNGLIKALTSLNDFSISGIFTRLKTETKSVAGQVSGLTKYFSEDGIFKGISQGMSAILGKIGNVGSAIGDMVSSITPAGIIVNGLGLTFVELSHNIAASIAAFTKMEGAVTTVLTNAGGTIKSFTGILDQFKKSIKDKVTIEKWKTITGCILSLLAALALLTLVDQTKLSDAILNVGLLLIELTAFYAALMAVNKFLANGNGADKMVLQFVAAMAAFGVAAGILAASLKSLQDVPFLKLAGDMIVIAGGMLAMVVAVSGLIGDGDDKMTASAAFIIAFALSMNILTKALLKLAQVDGETILKALLVFPAIIGVMKLIQLSVKGLKFTESTGLLVMCVSILAISSILTSLAKVDFGAIMLGLMNYVAIFGVMVTLALVIRAATRVVDKGDAVVKMSGMFISMAAAIGILSLVIQYLGSMDLGTIVKGGICVETMMLIFKSMAKNAKVSENGKALENNYLTMAGAILILGVAIDYIGNMDLGTVTQGLIVVSALLGLFALVENFHTNTKNLSGLTTLAGVIATLTVAMIALSLLPMDKALVASASLALVLAAFSLALDQLKAFGSRKVVSQIIKMGAVIAGLSAALVLLCQYDWKQILTATLGLSAVMLAFAAMSKIAKFGDKKSFDLGTMAKIAAIVVVLSGIAAMIAGSSIVLMSPDMLEKVASLGLMMAILTGVAAAVTGLAKLISNDKGMTKALLQIGGVILAVMAVGAIIYAVASQLNMESLITAVENMTLAVLAMSPFLILATALAVVAGKARLDPAATGASLLAILEVIGVIALVIGAIYALVGWVKTSFPEGFDNAISGTIELFGGIGQALGAFVSGIATGFSNNLDLSNMKDQLTQFVQAFDGISEENVNKFGTIAHAIFEIFAGLPTEGGLKNIWEGTVNFEEVANGFSSIIEAVNGLAGPINDSTDINMAKVTNLTTAGAALVALLNALPETGGWKQKILGEQDLGLFATNIGLFGDGMSSYARSISWISPELFNKIVTSAVSAQSIATLVNELPPSGGWQQKILGDKDLSSFGDSLSTFGTGVGQYVRSISWMNDTHFQKIVDSAKAAEGLAELNNKLPNTGGTLGQWIFGEKNLGDFGTQLTDFAAGLVALCNGSIETWRISNINQVTDKLVEILNKLNPNSGVGAFWSSTDFGVFGSQLSTFGLKLAEFAANVAEDKVDIDRIDKTADAIAKFADIAERTAKFDTTKMNAFTDWYKNIGIASYTAFKDAITSEDAVAQLTAAGATMTSTVILGMGDPKTQFGDIGDAVVQGFTSAIKKVDSLTILRNTGSIMGNTVYKSAADALAVRSPSKRFAELMKYCVLGLDLGLTKNLPVAQNAAANLAESVLDMMKETLGIHSPSYRVRQEVAGPIIDAFEAEFSGNTEAEKAAEAKANAIVEAFKAGFEDTSATRELMDLEAQLFELKLDPNLGTAEREAALQAYQADQNRKELELYTKDYMLSVQQYKTLLAEYGEEFSQTQEAKRTMMQNEITLRQQAQELSQTTAEEVAAAREAEMEGRQKMYELMESETADRMLQMKIRTKLSNEAKENNLGDEWLNYQIDALNYSIKNGTWEQDYADIMQPLVNELWAEWEKTYVPSSNATAIDADAIIKSVLGGMTIDEFAQNAEVAKFTDTAVQGIAQATQEAMKSATGASGDITEAMGAFDPSSLTTELNLQMDEIMAGFTEGIDGEGGFMDALGAGSLAQTLSNFADQASSFISEKASWASSGINSALNWAKGLLNGVRDPETVNIEQQAGDEAAQTAIDATHDAFGEHSPSTVYEDIGLNCVKGLVNGFTNDEANQIIADGMASFGQNLTAHMPNIVIDSEFSDSFSADLAAAIENSVGGLQIVVTPVLDMSTIDAQLADLHANTSTYSASSIASSPTVGKNRNIQNGGENTISGASSGTNITFNQYNTSPKALDRVSIYRDTKNQLSVLKEEINHND